MRLLLILIFPVIFALEIVEPVHAILANGSTVSIVDIGPGQAFSVAFSRIVHEGGVYGRGGYYDIAYAEVPDGWYTKHSYYSDPLRVIIRTSPEANGTYVIPIYVIDDKNLEKLPNITVFLNVTVRTDIFDVYAEGGSGGIKQPIRIRIQVKNKGSVGDVFVVIANDTYHYQRKDIFVPSKEVRVEELELLYPAPGNYTVSITVFPKYAPQLQKDLEVKVTVKESPLNDLSAARYGILIFHPVEYVTVGLLAFISWFLKFL